MRRSVRVVSLTSRRLATNQGVEARDQSSVAGSRETLSTLRLHPLGQSNDKHGRRRAATATGPH